MRTQNTIPFLALNRYNEGAETEVNDAETTSRIKTAVAISPNTKDATIHVNTNNGMVSLTGEVRNASVMQEAQKFAQNADCC